MEPEVVVPIVVAFISGGGLASVVAFRKTSAEAGSVAATTLIGVIEQLRDELERKDRVVYRLSERVAVLEAHIIGQGINLPSEGGG